MKTHLTPLILIAPAIMILTGCGKVPEPNPVSPPATNPPPEKSTAQTAIDGFTGKTAVDAGMRARSQIQDIAKKHKENEEGL